jgi:proline iminopeptidase
MYVDAELSLATARDVGNVKTWVTNEFEHDGVRQSPAVFTRLRQMVRDSGGPLG